MPHVPTKATVDNGETGRQDQRPCSPARTEESSVLHSVIRPLPSAIGDVDWAGARLYVISKGTRLRQAVPVSPEAIRYLTRYLDADGVPGPDEPLWRTRRGETRAVTYWAMRCVLQRANEKLGTNWSLHDLCHTAATRMATTRG